MEFSHTWCCKGLLQAILFLTHKSIQLLSLSTHIHKNLHSKSGACIHPRICVTLSVSACSSLLPPTQPNSLCM
ncbi:hypothetical protein DUNSADRAFT_4160 [Dunaliella salina]|uniref:Uncharacterized protein n=1 Tax=Dunaliella salina TaxID=3046 RepID=A0ABQ7GSJ6_DUNSA|nr:hypothetical protein DUNSADRAFT_4160 [Dunaliella salina]|eukprot:KAF5837589.1 hypothetical protein DUNSADRAFT_4160 [Dunaliella salina]